jgi:hypothetical protein
MLLLIDIFSINKGRGYENPSLEIIVTERCSTGGCPLEEACEHCYLIQSAISVAISYIISVYCEDYAGYFTVILSFLAFHFCSAYFIYLVSCILLLWQEVLADRLQVPLYLEAQRVHNTGVPTWHKLPFPRNSFWA